MVSNYLVLVQAEATKDGKYDFWEINVKRGKMTVTMMKFSKIREF